MNDNKKLETTLENQILNDDTKKQVEIVFDKMGEVAFGPLWKIKDLFSIAYNSCKKVSFLKFLQGLGQDVLSENINKEKLNKFSKMLLKNKNNQYITEILDSVFFAHSNRACTILGFIASKIINSNEVLYVDRVIAFALKELFDYELNIFTDFYLKKTHDTNNVADKRLVIIYDYNDEHRIILNKLIRLNILGNDLAGNRVFNNENKHPLKYELTFVSDALFNYIKMLGNIHYEIQI